MVMDRRDEIRQKARKEMERSGVLMTNGHFDYGNGFHGRVYLNPHQLFQHPSTIWRLAQDVLDIVVAEHVPGAELLVAADRVARPHLPEPAVQAVEVRW